MEDNSETATPISINQEALVYANKVYLSKSSRLPSDGQYLSLKGFILKY